MSDVTNPGLVNVVTQGDGLTLVNQTITVGPSTNPGPTAAGLTAAPGLGTDSPDQPVTVSPSTNPGPLVQGAALAPGLGVAPLSAGQVSDAMTAQLTIQGGTASPTSPNTINTMENTVVNQVYGTGAPARVFV
jgi:hypothetical protein